MERGTETTWVAVCVMVQVETSARYVEEWERLWRATCVTAPVSCHVPSVTAGLTRIDGRVADVVERVMCDYYYEMQTAAINCTHLFVMSSDVNIHTHTQH